MLKPKGSELHKQQATTALPGTRTTIPTPLGEIFSRLTFLVKLAAREWSLRVIQHGRVGMQRVPVQRWPLRSMVE